MLFLLFGRDRVRWPARRKRQADALVTQARWRPATAETGPRFMPSQPGLTELEKQVFQIGALLTGEAASAGNRVEVFSHGSDVYEALGAAIDQAAAPRSRRVLPHPQRRDRARGFATSSCAPPSVA